MTPENEERLRIAMSKLAVIENVQAKKKWGGSTHAATGAIAQARGRLGGRPKEGPKPMSSQARLINKLLLKGMARSEIAELIEKPAGTVRTIVRRYSLPRDN